MRIRRRVEPDRPRGPQTRLPHASPQSLARTRRRRRTFLPFLPFHFLFFPLPTKGKKDDFIGNHLLLTELKLISKSLDQVLSLFITLAPISPHHAQVTAPRPRIGRSIGPFFPDDRSPPIRPEKPPLFFS